MFKRTIVLFCFLTLGIVLILISPLLETSKNNLKFYQTMLDKSKNDSETIDCKITQIRYNVHKQIWLGGAKPNLHGELFSETSSLRFSSQRSTMEVTEHMTNLRSFIQEKKYFLLPDQSELELNPEGTVTYANNTTLDSQDIPQTWIPMQQILYFETDNADFHYQSDLFHAEELSFVKYKTPNHELSENMLQKTNISMQGTASGAYLILLEQNPHFNAQNLKATFYSPKNLFNEVKEEAKENE